MLTSTTTSYLLISSPTSDTRSAHGKSPCWKFQHLFVVCLCKRIRIILKQINLMVSVLFVNPILKYMKILMQDTLPFCRSSHTCGLLVFPQILQQAPYLELSPGQFFSWIPSLSQTHGSLLSSSQSLFKCCLFSENICDLYLYLQFLLLLYLSP